MLMKSGKIYRRLLYSPIRLMCPSIEIKGTATLYVSDSSTRPNSVNEMQKINNLKSDAINSILSMTRWIAVTYEEGTEVYEMGLIESPFANTIEYNQEVVIDDYGTVLLAGPDWYLYW